jgi:hypothetical protein
MSLAEDEAAVNPKARTNTNNLHFRPIVNFCGFFVLLISTERLHFGSLCCDDGGGTRTEMILRFWLTLYTEKGKELRSPGLLLFFSFFRISVIEISESREMNCFYLPRILHFFFFRSRLLSHFFLLSLPLLCSLLDRATLSVHFSSISPAVFLFPAFAR